MRHAPEHGEHAVEELEGLEDFRLLDIAPGERHAKGRAEFLCAPGCDPPGVNAVPARAPPTFREIQGNGTGRGAHLLVERAVTHTDPLQRTPKRPYEIKTDFKSLEHMLWPPFAFGLHAS